MPRHSAGIIGRWYAFSSTRTQHVLTIVSMCINNTKSSVSGSQPENNSQSLNYEQEYKQRENRLQLRRSRRLENERAVNSVSKPGVKDNDKEGSRKTLSEQRQQRLDRLRTRNRSVAQDLLMHAMMVKSFLYNYVENCYLS